tara:strand:+ start:197 stop:451 length:255 start_codon:yes stop_codon:yes gene_type:complete
MCIFRAPKSTPMAAPPPITPRVDKDTTLPTKKEVVDPDVKADVSYGGGVKKTAPSAGKKTGTDQLRIPLNTGTETGSTSGGINV